jgi:NitT/TauT family transport system substrate-binding protein
MERVSRRTTLAALGGAMASAILPRVASAQAAPLRVGLIPIWDVAPYYAAEQQGYFTAENIVVTPQIIRGGAAAIPALASDSLDIIYSNGTSIVQAISKGIDMRIILEGAPVGTVPPDPGALLKRKEDSFKTGKDLEGKVVAVNALRDVQWMIFSTWVRSTGGDPTKVQIIEIALPAMVAALKEKRVDAVFALDPFMTIGLADPTLEVLDWPLVRVHAGGPVAFFAITPQLAEKRPNDVRAFIRAYKRGVTWVNANQTKDVFINMVAAYSGMNADLVRRLKPIPAHGDITPNTLAKLTDLMTQNGLLTTKLDLRTKIFS